MIVLDTNVVSALMRKEPELAVVAWLDRQPAVVAVDRVLLQPPAVQRRRARMLDRPADDRRERPSARLAQQGLVRSHAACSSPMPWPARNDSSGSSGSPRMVK